MLAKNGGSALQNLRRPNLTYTACAPDDGRSWRRPNSRCQGRWPAWLRCVGDIRAPSSKPCFSERAYPTPSCCTVKRTAQHCLREINRRVRGPGRKGPDTLNRSLAMELRPPGLSPWSVASNSCGHHREERSDTGRVQTRNSCREAAPGTTHGVTSCAPLLPRGETTSIPDSNAGPNEQS